MGQCTLSLQAERGSGVPQDHSLLPKALISAFTSPGLQQADMFAASLRHEHLEKQIVLGKQIPAGRFTGAGKGEHEAQGTFQADVMHRR